jgi:ATP-dependent helicase/nuclease subunit A
MSNNFKLTKEQEEVLKDNSCNMLVPASAGSGKTTIMIDKVIKDITSKNISVKQFIIITFTELASKEMKEKLINKFLEKINEDNSNIDKKFLRDELEKIDSSSICTIDSLCSFIVKKYFYQINIDPNYSIISNEDALSYKSRVFEKVLDSWVKQEDQDIYDLCDMLSNNRSTDNLKELVFNFYEFLQNQIDYDDFEKNKLFSLYELNIDKNVAFNYFVNRFINNLKIYENKLKTIEKSDSLNKINDSVNYLISLIDYILGYKGNQDFLYRFYNLNFDSSKLCSARANKNMSSIDLEYLDIYKFAKRDFENNINYFKSIFIYKDVSQYQEALTKTKNMLSTFINFTNKFKESYEKLKSDKNLYEFNDIEHFCLKLLNIDNVRQEILKDYKYIFVDEYQDVNSLQEEIIQKISNGENLFMVGDFKQSIYSFRLCDPYIFKSKLDEYKDNSKGKVVKLNENFRSNPYILYFVNKVFDKIMTKDFGGINYKNDGNDLIKCEDFKEENFKTQTLSSICIYPIIKNKGKKDNEENDNLKVYKMSESTLKDNEKAFKKESIFVCQQIINITDKNHFIFDQKIGKLRPIEYKDIAILLRNRKKLFNDIVSRLTNIKVPIITSIKSNVNDSYEVAILNSFLRVINSTKDDVNIAVILSSPIYKLSPKDLLEIKKDKTKSLYSSIINYKSSFNNELSNKLKKFLDVIEECKEFSKFSSVYELLNFIMIKTDYKNHIEALDDGELKLNNLNIFVNSFLDKQFNNNLCDYIFYLDNYMKKNDTEISTSSGEENAVSIMTLHSSKGLEFPIVFLVGAGDNIYNDQDRGKENFYNSKDYGIGAKFYDINERIKFPTLAYSFIEEKHKINEFDEEIRLLYVGLTRAKNQLFITGITDISKTELIDEKSTNVSENNCYLRLILSAFNKVEFDSVILNDGEYKDDNQSLYIKKINIEDICEDNSYNLSSLDSSKIDYKFYEENLKKYIDFVYPYIDSTTLAIKNSVTSLNQNGEEDLFSNYTFMPKNLTKSENNINSTDSIELGNMYHNILQYLIDENFNDIDGMKLKLQSIVKKYELNYDLTNLNYEILFNCYRDIQELCKGYKIYTERKFMMYVPYNEIITSSTLTDKVLIQGTIDLMLINHNNAILLDYKTTKNDDKDVLKNKYGIQLFIYKKAIENSYNVKVSDVYIYSILTNKLIKLDI